MLESFPTPNIVNYYVISMVNWDNNIILINHRLAVNIIYNGIKLYIHHTSHNILC